MDTLLQIKHRHFSPAFAAVLAAPASADETLPTIPDGMRVQGSDVESATYGRPSPHEGGVIRRVRERPPTPTAASADTPLQVLHGIITPNELRYIRDHAGTPDIDPATHRLLLLHGLVDRPLQFTMDDLLRFPSVSAIHFLECSGNTAFRKTQRIKKSWTARDTRGLLSCSEWTGVRLADVLAEAGIQPGAKWLLAEGADETAQAAVIGRDGAPVSDISAIGPALRGVRWESNTPNEWLQQAVQLAHRLTALRSTAAELTHAS